MSADAIKNQRFWYLDTLRFLLIFVVVIHHAAIGYGAKWHRSFFIDSVGNSGGGSRLYDVLFLMSDTFMIPGLFFLAGLFAIPSLKRRGVGSFIKERFFRLGIPLVLGVVFISPIHVYSKHLTESPFPSGYMDFWLNSFFGSKFQITSFWFLYYLLFLSAILLLIYKGFPKIWGYYLRWMQWCLRHPWWALALFCIKGAILVGGSDFFWGARWWTHIFPSMMVIGSQFLLNALYFFSGALLGATAFLEKPDAMEGISKKWTLWLGLTIVCSVAYFAYIFAYDEAAYASNFRHAFSYYGYTFTQAWPLFLSDAPGILARTTLFVLTGVFTNLLFLSGTYRLLNVPHKIWISLGACAYGIYIFHEVFQVFPAYWMMDLDLPLFVKFGALTLIGFLASWGLTHLLRQLPGFKRIL
ncbi:MAG: acyltransferase [bacterium]|nr:acyltransferase [bacterium]